MDQSILSDQSDLTDPPSDLPSSPLSVLSKSPSISPRSSLCLRPDGSGRLLSPPSTIPSGSASPLKAQDAVEPEIHVNPDGPPPAKRRKTEPKPRTTQRLNLSDTSDLSDEQDKILSQLKSVLRKKKKIVIIAGAGISVSAGIPDFRSSNGLFATLKNQHKTGGSGKQLFDASVYKHNDSTEKFHTMLRDLDQLTKSAEPTAFHHLIASLAKEGRLLRLYSQNVDGLDTALPPLATTVPLGMKGPWPKTIQLHGCLAKMRCSKCNEITSFDATLFEGPEAPLCRSCEETDNVRTSYAGKRSHGIGRLRPRMVLYNELNEDQEAIGKVVTADLKARPDAVIVVGTSMKIRGVRNMVKDMCQITRKRKDGITAWINLDSEPSGNDLRDCWDLVVQAKSDDIASHVALPRWDSIEQGEETIIDQKQMEDGLRRGGKVEIEIRRSTSVERTPVKTEALDETPAEAKPKSVDRVQGIPTPTASPKMRVRTSLPTGKSQEKKTSKQSQLLFTNKVAKPNSTSANDKPKKSANRKPRQTKKEETKTAAKITFKATKPVTSVPSKVPAKRSPDFDTPSLSVDVDAANGKVDFSLRPRSTFESQSRGPTTPVQSDGITEEGTVSPPSKPRGFETMID